MKKISLKMIIYAFLALICFGVAGYLFYVGFFGTMNFFGWKAGIEDNSNRGIMSFFYVVVGGGFSYIILAISIIATIIGSIVGFIGVLFSETTIKLYKAKPLKSTDKIIINNTEKLPGK